MDNILFLFFLFIALELFEVNWQKSDSLYGVIYNNYLIYKKSLFTFFIFNPTFFYALFLLVYLNVDSMLLIAIAVVKFIDVFFKISMMKKLDNGEKMEDIMRVNAKMGFTFRYMNVLIYPISFLFAVNYF